MLLSADNASREHSRDQSCRVRMISRRHSIIAVRAVSHIDKINIECETLDLKDVYSEISPEERRVRLTLRPPNCSSFIKGSIVITREYVLHRRFCCFVACLAEKSCDVCSFQVLNFIFYVFFVF